MARWSWIAARKGVCCIGLDILRLRGAEPELVGLRLLVGCWCRFASTYVAWRDGWKGEHFFFVEYVCADCLTSTEYEQQKIDVTQ